MAARPVTPGTFSNYLKTAPKFLYLLSVSGVGVTTKFFGRDGYSPPDLSTGR
jgi:hypothetical protein